MILYAPHEGGDREVLLPMKLGRGKERWIHMETHFWMRWQEVYVSPGFLSKGRWRKWGTGLGMAIGKFGKANV